MKKQFLALFLFPFALQAGLGLTLDAGVGIRRGDFNWSIGELDKSVDVVSELRWNDIKAVDLCVEGRLPYAGGKSVGFELHYAPIFEGMVTDSDFLLSGKRAEFSHTESDADKGYLLDLTLKSDNYFPLLGNSLIANFTGGYCYHRQHLSSIEGIQLVDGQESDLKGNNSRYTTLWSGAFLGADAITAMTYPLTASVGYRFQYMSYHATGHWNLRDDIVEPFSHKASQAYANIIIARASYYILPMITLGFEAQWQYFFAKDGTDETSVRTKDGVIIAKGRLNHVGWNNRIYLIHLALSF